MHGHLLVLLLQVLDIATHEIAVPIEGDTPDLDEIEALLAGDNGAGRTLTPHPTPAPSLRLTAGSRNEVCVVGGAEERDT